MARLPSGPLGYQALKLEIAGASRAGGTGAVHNVRLAAYAREKSEERPYGVVNDFIASRLGLAIGAPVPPGELVAIGYGATYGYVSVGFGENGQNPPPADLDALVGDRLWEATGIVALDHWVFNGDRHDDNLGYLPTLGVAAFDHDCALIGPKPPDPLKSLEDHRHKPLLGHPIARILPTIEYLEEWLERIKSVRDEEIKRIVGTCQLARLVDRNLAEALVDFIVHRRDYLRILVEAARDDFAVVTQWTIPERG
ncbi:hypothetical protein GCM10009785_35200 [Brooklawnia cerclae]|uniref:Phosphatidylinositol kinase n=1 Tax=Brooklawnia cerclae TaxID=349934 RepID=A0ABX0SDR5_9ACTN|nr:hypothetical protein [Brooklawnia cerclae]NIH55365.1 hypothetical protein [Brooklawnia cerclae]